MSNDLNNSVQGSQWPHLPIPIMVNKLRTWCVTDDWLITDRYGIPDTKIETKKNYNLKIFEKKLSCFKFNNYNGPAVNIFLRLPKPWRHFRHNINKTQTQWRSDVCKWRHFIFHFILVVCKLKIVCLCNS